MVTQQQIQELSDDIVRKFHPDKVVLFGSYAYGKPTEDSDVDLLVVLPSESQNATKALDILKAVHAGFPLDLLAYTPEYINYRVSNNDFFLQEIVAKGEVLYESTYSRVA